MNSWLPGCLTAPTDSPPPCWDCSHHLHQMVSQVLAGLCLCHHQLAQHIPPLVSEVLQDSLMLLRFLLLIPSGHPLVTQVLQLHSLPYRTWCSAISASAAKGSNLGSLKNSDTTGTFQQGLFLILSLLTPYLHASFFHLHVPPRTSCLSPFYLPSTKPSYIASS